MSDQQNFKVKKPSLTIGYWRPWKENSNFVDSYLDYAKDISLAKYSADTVGKYISSASKEQVQAINRAGQALGQGMNVLSNQIAESSKEQVQAINRAGQALGQGMNVLSNQMSDISSELNFLNRNFCLQIEQQKLSNLLLENISELLHLPESEKERQQAIELGIKFFVNAQKDLDLFDNSLKYFLKAKTFQEEDYFVLHRLGLIYMHSPNHINVEKALECFSKAAKYASVESDPNAIELLNALCSNLKNVNTKTTNKLNGINHFLEDSYDKAAFAAYVLGQFELAVNHQSNALKIKKSAENYFKLAKYQTRIKKIASCVSNLKKAIEKQPSIAIAVFGEIDLINEPNVLKLIEEKNKLIDDKIIGLTNQYEKINSEKSSNVIKVLNKLKKKGYDLKIVEFKKYSDLEKDLDEDIENAKNKIDQLITLINKTEYIINKSEFANTILSLSNAKDTSLENMMQIIKNAIILHEDNLIKIGDKYAGGIVFWIDETGEHGLVASEQDLVDNAIWGSNGKIGTKKTLGSGMNNTKLIIENASWFMKKGFFSSKKTSLLTAARLCKDLTLNGYNDWFLPSKDELEQMLKYSVEIGGFKSKNGWYWSSSEEDEYNAWVDSFIYSKNQLTTDRGFGAPTGVPKAVRAVREFKL